MKLKNNFNQSEAEFETLNSTKLQSIKLSNAQNNNN